jgi:hypothetical protein
VHPGEAAEAQRLARRVFQASGRPQEEARHHPRRISAQRRQVLLHHGRRPAQVHPGPARHRQDDDHHVRIASEASAKRQRAGAAGRSSGSGAQATSFFCSSRAGERSERAQTTSFFCVRERSGREKRASSNNLLLLRERSGREKRASANNLLLLCSLCSRASFVCARPKKC